MNGKSFPSNPYVVGMPLSGKSGFYGRHELLVSIENILKAKEQNVVVLFGQRRIGKTSLLHQIVRKFKNHNNVVPVYFDLQGREQNRLGEVLYVMAQKITRALKMPPVKEEQFNDTGSFFQKEFLSSIKSQLGYRRLLLLFDEFDVLSDQLTSPEAASESLFSYLQKLIIHQHQIVFVFVVGRRIEELATHFHSIFKLAQYKKIGLLKEKDARELITEPVKNVLTFEEQAIKAILKLTSGHPYFTQLICYETFNHMKERDQRVVAEVDILNLVDQIIETGHGALSWFWDGLPRAERFVMSAIAYVTYKTGLATEENIRQILEKHRIVLTGLELKDAPERLLEWKMLFRKNDTQSYYFVVDLVRLWILKAHPLQNARRDIDLISKRALRLYENAREAHTNGDLEYARDEYQRALNANPNHSGAQLGLAQVLFELGDVDAAIEAFVLAYHIDEISARDGLVQARQKKGKILEDEGQEDKALFQYEKAFEIAQQNEAIRHCLARIWSKRGDAALLTKNLNASFENYQKAISFDDSDATKRSIQDNLIAYIEQAKKRENYDETVQGIDMLKKLFPQSKVVLDLEIAFLTHRGDTLAQETQKFEESINAYQRALDLNPGNETLMQKIELTRAAKERQFKAERLFQKGFIAHQDREWEIAKTTWLQMLKMDLLNYGGHNIAAFLAEANEMQAKQPSMLLELLPPRDVICNRIVTWSVIIHNNGDDDLRKVTLSRGPNKILKAFDLVAGAKQIITFTDIYTQKGPCCEKITATAVTTSGRVLNCLASIRVEVKEKLIPNLSIQLSSDEQTIEAGNKINWKVSIRNIGDDDLRNVTISCGTKQLANPFYLSVGESQNITFTQTYTHKGRKTEEVAVTATAICGQVVNKVASAKFHVV
jgi:tetratricopeptide (TPR) repeat protein